MTAVTQCPQCGTRFRVVPDQLKISQGWVRCGKCAEVFNARDAIESALKPRQATQSSAVAPPQVSIVLRQQEPVAPSADAGALAEANAPPAHPVEQPQPANSPPTQPLGGATSPGRAPLSLSEVALVALQQTVAVWVRAPAPGTESKHEHMHGEPVSGTARAIGPAVAVQVTADTTLPLHTGQQTPDDALSSHTDRPTTDPLLPSHTDQPTANQLVDAPVALPAEPDKLVAPSDQALSPQPRPQADVGFIRQARRQAAWSSGPARAALVALVMLASSLLAFQVTVHERDRLAVMMPGLKPWLVQLCEPMGCEIGPLRRIEAVEIVSTELVRAKDGSYRFEMGLRNQAALQVAMPAVELSLTDRNGEAVLRRVLLPDDWALAPGELPAASETNLTLKMSLINPDELRMEGFRALVFYP